MNIQSHPGCNTVARPSPYEVNVKEFGPVAASAIGLAQAAGAGASAVCSFSGDALGKLGEAAADIVSNLDNEIADLATSGYSLLQQGSSAVVETAAQACDEIVEFGEAVGDTVSEIADAVSSAFSGAVGYAAVGLAAGDALINELA